MAKERSRYVDRGEIGRGGMGTVHKVDDRHLARSVALKTVKSGASPSTTNRFLAEAQITGQLDHPNVAPVHELGKTTDGRPFYTMKLVSGETLAESIARLHASEFDGRELERVIRIVIKVSEALAFAHSRGVLHRDLKPANIMIGTHGQVYVMDWGLALMKPTLQAVKRDGAAGRPVEVSTELPAEKNAAVGTPAYMAREQALGAFDLLDERTDVYGLGGLLYHILTGWPPHSGGGWKETVRLAKKGEVVPPQQACPDRALPPRLCEIAMVALAIDPGERYQTVDELREELEDFLRGGGWFATQTFAAGSTIIRAGDEASEAYVIARGRCGVFREADGERVFLRELGPGDVFGEMAILHAETRTATVEAIDEVTVRVVTPEAFERELGSGSWTGALIRQITERFLELEQRTL